MPTAIWIDERGTIVRPSDVAFATDTFKDMTGVESGPHLAALRAWVKGEAVSPDEAERLDRQPPPTDDEQHARAEFSLAWLLHRRGKPEAAERHFVRAGELAPHDFTIRRGSMPIRGLDPMGVDFADMFTEWMQAGSPYYGRRS